jgi:hypothetical protein
LNPALLKSVAPAGMSIHVPKGSLPQVETAFQSVPPNRRDVWRLQRLATEDSFATLAKRYNTAAALVSSANRDELPDAGSFVVIPAAYPGDRVPVRTAARSTARSTAKPTARKSAPRAAPPRSAASKGAPQGKGSKVRASSPVEKNPAKASAPQPTAGHAG